MTRHGQLVADWVEIFAPARIRKSDEHRSVLDALLRVEAAFSGSSLCETRASMAAGVAD